MLNHSQRLLKISKVCLFNGLSNLSNELRLLEWHDYPLKPLPRSFQPGKLVDLIMHRSRIWQLREEFRVRFPLLQFFLLVFYFFLFFIFFIFKIRFLIA